LGRIINTEGADKERQRLTRSIILALRELMKQTQPDDNCRDLVAYISAALGEIFETVENSVAAWEKKGYWLKADRYRLEWIWSEQIGLKMRKAVQEDDWAEIAKLSAQIGQKFSKVKVPVRHQLGTPWIGAWEKLKKAAG
jgi:hypothetical protein